MEPKMIKSLLARFH